MEKEIHKIPIDDEKEIWIDGSRVYYENGEVKVDYREGIKNTPYKPVNEMRKITKAVLYLKGKYIQGCNIKRPNL